MYIIIPKMMQNPSSDETLPNSSYVINNHSNNSNYTHDKYIYPLSYDFSDNLSSNEKMGKVNFM
jgi:hypothetical protein